MCYSCTEKDKHADIEITSEGRKLTFLRLDSAVFKGDYSNTIDFQNKIKAQFGSMYCKYVENILGLGYCDSLATISNLRTFSSNQDFIQLNNEIDRFYNSQRIDSLQEELLFLVLRMEKLISNYRAPKFILMNSGFNVSAVSDKEYVAVGLEFFLGSENQFTKSVALPQYQKDDMHIRQLVPTVAKSMAYFRLNELDTNSQDIDFLSTMIYHGKAYYLAKLAIGEIEDGTLMAWSADQVEWMDNYALNCWKEVANQEVMFSKNKIE
ncbi:MAG: hypothetical protein ACKO8Q_10945, partial [Bacteroidota bacterium]